ncbi:tetratricopeptide repeat protein [Flavobacteriales bacterium]|nr:tetratricopeptide repeat protein [Flavobacteriales bacterium]
MTGKKHFDEGLRRIAECKYKAALKAFDKAIEMEDKNADFHSERGVTLFHLSRKKDALEALNKALILEPNNPYRYSSRAFLKDAMGDTKGAINDYMKCVEIDPEDAIAFNNLGILEEKIGRQSIAKKHFNKADELIQILDDNKIGLEDSAEFKIEPKNVQKEINQEKKTLKENGRVGIILQVFKNRSTRKEFFKFIKDGIKK